MNIDFFIPLDKIPTVTAQQKGVTIINGRPHFYTKQEVKAVADFYRFILKTHRPPLPMTGAVAVVIGFRFPAKKPYKDGRPKVTRPDVENMLKLIFDVMTELGYWLDDSQIWYYTAYKVYSDVPGVEFRIEEVDKKKAVYSISETGGQTYDD